MLAKLGTPRQPESMEGHPRAKYANGDLENKVKRGSKVVLKKLSLAYVELMES